MAERVAKLEMEARELYRKVDAACPEMYLRNYDPARECPGDRDVYPIREAWRKAVLYSGYAAQWLARLGELLRRKAGIAEPAPQEPPAGESKAGEPPKPRGRTA